MIKTILKNKVFILILLAALGVAGYFQFRDNETGTGYRTVAVSRGDIEAVVTATGTVNAVTTVLVGTQVSGTIREIYADYNARVRKGQVIAQIDPALYEAQLDQASANLLSAKAALQKAAIAQKDSERAMARSRELYSKGMIALADYETSASLDETARAQIDAARAQLAQSEAQVRIARTNLKYTRITSPVDGTVISRAVDAGQTVAASFQTPTLFTIAHDLTKMQIDSSVAEADIGRVQAGQDVDFSVDAYPEKVFRGTVSEVRNAPVTVQNVVTYNAVVLLDNPDLRLKPGMTANVTIKVMKKPGVIRVPNAALRYSPKPDAGGKPMPEKDRKGRAVWRLVNDRPERVAVTLGISDGQFTELLTGELKEGDQVIIEARQTNRNSNSPARAPRMF